VVVVVVQSRTATLDREQAVAVALDRKIKVAHPAMQLRHHSLLRTALRWRQHELKVRQQTLPRPATSCASHLDILIELHTL
jgi:hypothetical protein